MAPGGGEWGMRCRGRKGEVVAGGLWAVLLGLGFSSSLSLPFLLLSFLGSSSCYILVGR